MSALENMAKAYIGYLVGSETSEEVANIKPDLEGISAMRAAVESLKTFADSAVVAGHGVPPESFKAMIEAILDGK